MGYRAKDAKEHPGSSRYRLMEVVLVDQDGEPAAGAVARVLVVDSQLETLRYVQENMAEFVGNLVRVRRMKEDRICDVEENAQLFERNLQPLFALISATAQDHILDKLSGSLKKALLLMAMDRYSCDSERICRALGLSKVKLERELKRCGLVNQLA